jgi:hypothetical protein
MERSLLSNGFELVELERMGRMKRLAVLLAV